MINVIGAMIVGLIIGLLALFIYPETAVMGSVATLALGVGGALIASVAVSHGRSSFQRPGCFVSVVGAVALILIARLIGWR
jgi:uncharacterized membrane protein YeaQ/YmgE (transglycosylase-associated protein family)